LNDFLKSYASDFASYLIEVLCEKNQLNQIEQIILFGSVAKDSATRESDVDIFIEVKKSSKKIESLIKEIVEKFYQSREAAIFKTRGIENSINIIVGKIEDWKELSQDITFNGIVLWGKYEVGKKEKELQWIILFWDKIEKNRGNFLNKIYGYNLKGKHHPGLLKQIDGKKIGKSAIMIPIHKKNEILELIKNHKVNAKIIEL